MPFSRSRPSTSFWCSHWLDVSSNPTPGHHSHTADTVRSKIVVRSNRRSSEHAPLRQSRPITTHATSESNQSNLKMLLWFCVSHTTSDTYRLTECRTSFWLQKQQYQYPVRSPRVRFPMNPHLLRSSYQMQCQYPFDVDVVQLMRC